MKKLRFTLFIIALFLMIAGLIHNKNAYKNIMLIKLAYKANTGDVISQREYGKHLLSENKPKGEGWLLKAAAGDDDYAGQYLVGWYGQKTRTDARLSSKLELLEMFAARGKAWAHIELSNYYYSINDEERWFQYQLNAAELGDVDTNIFIGDLYVDGYIDDKHYFPSNINLAFNYYAAAKSDGRALERLGDIYVLGIGDEKQDFSKAAELYESAFAYNQSTTAERKIKNLHKYGLIGEFKRPEVVQTALLLDNLNDTIESVKGGLLWIDSHISTYYNKDKVEESTQEVEARMKELAISLQPYDCQDKKPSECALEHGDKLFEARAYEDALGYYYKALLSADDEYAPALRTVNNYLVGLYEADRYTEQRYIDRDAYLSMQGNIYRQIAKVWKYLGNSELSTVHYTEAVYLGDRYSQNLFGWMHIRQSLSKSDIIIGCSWVYLSRYSAHSMQYCNDKLSDEDLEAVGELTKEHFKDPILVGSVVILRD